MLTATKAQSVMEWRSQDLNLVFFFLAPKIILYQATEEREL